MKTGVSRQFDPDDSKETLLEFDTLPLNFPIRQNDFSHMTVRASETNYTTLKNYIDTIKREGYEIKRLSVDLYAKTSFPFSGFILSIFGITFGFSIKKRYGGLARGIGLCILIGVLYWTTYSLSLSMGYAGRINPMLSSWLANIVFGVIVGVTYFRAMKL